MFEKILDKVNNNPTLSSSSSPKQRPSHPHFLKKSSIVSSNERGRSRYDH